MRDLNFETAGAALSVSDCISLAPGMALQGVRMRYGRNAEIFGAGEKAEYVYRVVSGAVRTIRFSADGRRQILGFHLPGDIFGLETGARHSFSAESIAGADVALVRRSLIEAAVAEDPRAALALTQLFARELHAAQEHALVLGLKGASERVAAFILHLTDRFAANADLDLPMSRADIADYLALTIETVSRAFTQMERDRIIALPCARHVIVRDREALELMEAA